MFEINLHITFQMIFLVRYLDISEDIVFPKRVSFNTVEISSIQTGNDEEWTSSTYHSTQWAP
jgi:hypothetical protein